VDIQLNAKLADLELGAENNEIASRSALVSDDLLENWAAPEVPPLTSPHSSPSLGLRCRVLLSVISRETIFSAM
jgi:hypothetical protein